MMNTKFYALLMTLLFGVVGVAFALSDAVQATWTATPSEATVGDVIRLILTVEHPEGYRVIVPDISETWGDFEVRTVGQPVIQTDDDSSEITTIPLDVALMTVGTFTLPDLSVTVYDTDGQAMYVNPSPLTINITSVLQEGDTTLRDIKGQVDMVVPQVTSPVGAILLLVFVAIGVVTFGVYTLKKRRTVDIVDNRTPDEKALDELKRIEGLNLPALNQFKQHYDLISNCLRQYMQDGLQIQAMERTTSELKQMLRQSELQPDIVRDLMDLLSICDVVRYGSIEPEQSSADSLGARVAYIIERTRPQPEPTLEPERSVA